MKSRALLLLGSLLIPQIACEHASPDDARAAEPSDEAALRELGTSETLADFEQVVSALRSLYAPLERKQVRYKFSFDALVSEARAQLSEQTGDAAHRRTLQAFLSRFHDGHLSLQNAGDKGYQRPALPLLIMPIEDTFVVANVYDDEASPQLQVGDEVVSIDGVPIADAVGRFLPYVGMQNELAELHRAAYLLTSRPWYLAEDLDMQRPARIVVRGADGAEREALVHWQPSLPITPALPAPPATGTLAARNLVFASSEVDEVVSRRIDAVGLSEPFFLTATAKRELGPFRRVTISDSSLATLNASPSAVLQLGLFAATYEYAGKRLLFLRIPTYSPNDVSLATRYLRALLSEYASQVDGLVLDQTHNPGGSGAFEDQLESLLMKRPVARTGHRLRADRWWFQLYQDATYVTSRGDAQASEALAEVVRSRDAIDHANEAGALLTEPLLLPFDLPRRAPDPSHWNKPLLVLSDELSSSCADYFAAAMKQEGSATLFGERTTGAGGNVELVTRLNHSGAQLLLTRSLGIVADGTGTYSDASYIEDNGVEPDVRHPHTLADLRAGFVGYIRAFSDALIQKIESAPH